LGLQSISRDIKLLRLSTPPPYDAVNIYIVKLGKSVCLVDAGPATDECYRQVEHALAEEGSRIGDIEAILLTHSHVDHAGLAGRLQEQSGCAVYVHPGDLQWVVEPVGKTAEKFGRLIDELWEPEVRGLVQSAFALNTRRLKAHFAHVEPTPLPVNSEKYGLHALEAPGHTPGSTVYLSGSRVGLCGDTLLDTQTLLIDNLHAYFGTLSKLGSLGVYSLWPGHGGVLEPAWKWVEAVRQKYLGRVETVKRIIKEPRTLFEVARSLYGESLVWDPNTVRAGLSYALLQTKTYLEYLVEERLAEKKFRDRLTYYQSCGVV
jgi:glyoxylase-like metal-dependent hydrolase (beta-lactamase superfamily II)